MEEYETRKCFNCGAQMTYSKLHSSWFCELCGATENPANDLNNELPDYIK